MIFQYSGMYFSNKIGIKSDGKCHPSSKGSFFPTFLLKIGSWAVLEASWRHLGPSWQKFWAVLGPQDASKTATWPPRRPQDATKTYPRAAQNTSQDALGSPRPPRTSKTSKMTPKSRWGTPRGLVFGAYMGAFGVGFWLIFY